MDASAPTVIDFGAHLYPEGSLPETDADPDRDLNRLVGPALTDPAVLLGWMDEAGIDAAVLSQPYFMGNDDVDAVAHANDTLAATVADEERFFGLAAIPVGAGPAAAAAELERALDMGMHGGALETTSSGIDLTDPANDALFEVADRVRCPLLVHPTLNASLGADVLDDTYQLNAIFGREVALARSISMAIHTGVYDRFDRLRLVFHHLGGNIAAMLGRVHLRLDVGRWIDQEAITPWEEFRAQLRERVYLDSSGFFGYPSPVAVAVDELGPTRVAFGSDVPYEARSGSELASFVESIDEALDDPTDTQAVLGETALALLEGT